MMRVPAVVVFAIGAVAGVGGMFVRGDVADVPVDRIIRNLSARVASQASDPKLVATLARVHAMAYALKVDELSVDKRTFEPLEGLTDRNTPADRVIPAGSVAKQRMAGQHLAEALKYYRMALELAPGDARVRLGYAWCLDQAGRRTEAILEYRQVIARAWEDEKTLDHTGPGPEPVSAEAMDYLLKLLDPQKDAPEIQTLRARRQRLAALPRMVTPLVVPLRDDLAVADLLTGVPSVSFDADASGVAREWTWITPSVGWLVWDPKGRGQVRSGLQLFGNVTFWLFWPDGYEALCALDDNGDGQLTGNELSGLAIWRDLNQDGISQPGEVEPLSGMGISALSCEHRRLPAASSIAAFSPRGVTLRDGRTRPSYDVWLRPREARLTE
jgi:hypothetical protein